jgi:hypothetical protein
MKTTKRAICFRTLWLFAMGTALVVIPPFVYAQEDFSLEFSEDGSSPPVEHIPSLEDISKLMGNPIAVVTWRAIRGNMRFKRAVKCGNYERRFFARDGLAVFEDRAELKDGWQEWYQTGANEIPEGETLESLLNETWDWDLGITLYQENLDKTMLIKFSPFDGDAFAKTEDGSLYAFGYWYFIDGKL